MIVNKDHNHGDYEIHSYEPGKLKINDLIYNQSVIVSSHELTLWPPQQFSQLNADSFNDIVVMQPNIVLIGTGDELIFPDPSILAPFYNAHIGVEVMSTLAACRTFNVLMSEGRNVVAALLIR